MHYRMRPELAEATRLTRLGKLVEATALIQRMLRGEPIADPTSGGSAVIDAEYAVVDDGDVSPEPPPPDEQLGAAKAKWASRPHRSLRDAVSSAAAFAKLFGEGPASRPVSEPLPEGASFTAATYADAEGSRDYKLYIPSLRSREGLPLIVMLHGCTQSPDDFAAGTRMNSLAEEHGFLVAYPAQDSLANARRCWNWFKPQDQRRGRGEPSLIAGITREVMRDHPVDPGRIYIAGLSAGGAAAAIMADAYPDLYAAVGVHSGLPAGAATDLSSAFDAMRMGAKIGDRPGRFVPAIIFHGENDPIVNPSNGGALAAQALRRATELSRTTEHGEAPGGHAYVRTTYADQTGRTVCEHWSIRGAGHAWAGGSGSGSHTDPQGPDASRHMVRFFFEHGRSGSCIPAHRRKRGKGA
jgi:poly(hydroxyalkanoate) depolymerase family esterase